MRIYAAAVYAFLYSPIALIVLFSFNAGRSGTQFLCCSLDWYPRTFGNVLMVDGHVQTFNYNPRKPPNDKLATDFKRRNLYVNP